MQCPHCQQAVRLTWGIYLRNPHGRYPCAHCGRRMRARMPFSYKIDLLVVDLVIWGIPFVLGVVAGFGAFGLTVLSVLMLSLAMVVTMLIDRYVEDTRAPIVKARDP